MKTTWIGTEQGQLLSWLHKACRKQLFTWVRCSAGFRALLSLQYQRPHRKLGRCWGVGGMGGQPVEAARSYLCRTPSGLVYTESTLVTTPAGRVTPPLPACSATAPCSCLPQQCDGLQVVLPRSGHLLFPKSGISCLREKRQMPGHVRDSRCLSGSLRLPVLRWDESPFE